MPRFAQFVPEGVIPAVLLPFTMISRSTRNPFAAI